MTIEKILEHVKAENQNLGDEAARVLAEAMLEEVNNLKLEGISSIDKMDILQKNKEYLDKKSNELTIKFYGDYEWYTYFCYRRGLRLNLFLNLLSLKTK